MRIEDHVQKVKIGIHTIEPYARNLKYDEVQKVTDYLADQRDIQVIKKDPYNIDRHLKSTYGVENGVRLRIYQSHNKSNGIGIAINPSSLLEGEYQPTKLWKPTKETCAILKRQLKSYLDELRLPFLDPDHLSTSEIDLTMDLWMDDSVDLREMIRLCWHCKLPRHFRRKRLADKESNQYYFGIKTNGILIKAYDKVHELEKYGRCPSKLKGKKILRIELSLKREAFLKKLDLDQNASFYKMMHTGYAQAEDILCGYLHKMFPCSGEFLSYRKVKKIVERNIRDELLRDQMLFLLKQTSRSAGLDTATEKLKDDYKHVDDRRIKKIYTTFY